jgi:hypothetical protein
MKRFLLILSFVFVGSARLFAQDDDAGNDNQKIRDKMNEFIQKRLDLTKEEANKFTPVFLRYFKEWRQTIRENKGDRLIMQQKIVDLRLRYRTEFRGIVGERRGDQVFKYQEDFIRGVKDQLKERRNDPTSRPPRRNVTNFINK